MSIQFDNPYTGDVEYFNDMTKVKAYLTNGKVQTYILGEELVINNPSVKMFEVYSESRGIVRLNRNWMPSGV